MRYPRLPAGWDRILQIKPSLISTLFSLLKHKSDLKYSNAALK
jgi:hypothetical protein